MKTSTPFFNSCNNQNRRRKDGFTIIEVFIAVAVIALLTLVVIANFPKIGFQLAIPRAAYKFEQDFRRAQAMSLSSPTFKDSEGVTHAVSGYGLYLDITQNNKQYIMYADSATGSTPNNHRYDISGSDYIVETIDLEVGIIIKQINGIDATAVSVNLVGIDNTVTLTPEPSGNSIEIVLAVESNPTQTKTISINKNGLIQIGGPIFSGIVCSADSDCGTNGLGSPYCQGSVVYKNYITHTCNNAGAINSNCSSSSSPQPQEMCSIVDWAKSESAGDRSWGSVATSADGVNLLAGVYPGGLYISHDSGATWNATGGIGGNQAWQRVLYVDDGQPGYDGDHLITTIEPESFGGPGHIWISHNGGETWHVPLEEPGGKWGGLLASSADGKRVILGSYGTAKGPYIGRLYISSDYGETWDEVQPDPAYVDQEWQAGAISADGKHLIVGSYCSGGAHCGRLWVSHEYGATGTWTETRPLDENAGKQWQSVASSTDGKHLIAGVDGGLLYIGAYSAEGALSWTETQPAEENDNKKWRALASSPDGSQLIAGIYPGPLYMSSDYGAEGTWTEVQPAGSGSKKWQAAAYSLDGTRAIVVIDGGGIYISSNQFCQSGSCVSGSPVAACYSKSNCGTDGLGGPYCQGNDIYRDMTTYTCNSPGTTSANCTSASLAELQQTCPRVLWAETQPAGDVNKHWGAVASSADGTHLIASVYRTSYIINGTPSLSIPHLYVSSDSGDTWTETQPTGDVDEKWVSLSSSADGTHLIARTSYVGRLYISSNSGDTWAETQPVVGVNKSWDTVALSADGVHVIAGGWLRWLNRLYISSDFGTTWAETQPVGDVSKWWQAVALNSDGTRFIAGVFQGQLGDGGRLYIGNSQMCLSGSCVPE